MAAIVYDDDDDDVNRIIPLVPYEWLPIDRINSTDTMKVFTSDNELYNQFLSGGMVGWVNVQLQVRLYYTDGRVLFDEWYIYRIIDGTVYITLMNDRFTQVVAWMDGPSVVHL